MRAVLVASVLALSACAVGTDVEDEGNGGAAGSSSVGGSASGGTSSGGSGGGWATGGDGGGPAGGQGGTGAGASGGTGGSGGTSGSGGTGGTGGTGGSGGTGGTGCPASNSCAAAQDLGSVSGDSGAGTVQQSGTGSVFFKVRVTEDNSSPLGQKLVLQVSLTVPSGADYDLYAYVNTGSDVSPCGMSPAKKSDAGGTGANEQLKLSWGEGTIANNDDDGRTVVIEVRYKSGACDASNKWQLIGAGNV